MNNTEQRITAAAKVLGKAMAKLAKDDPEMARRLSAALATEVDAVRMGR